MALTISNPELEARLRAAAASRSQSVEEYLAGLVGGAPSTQGAEGGSEPRDPEVAALLDRVAPLLGLTREEAQRGWRSRNRPGPGPASSGDAGEAARQRFRGFAGLLEGASYGNSSTAGIDADLAREYGSSGPS